MTEIRPPKFLTGIERFDTCARHTPNAGAVAGVARCQPDRQTAYGLSLDLLAGHPKSILRYHPPLFENTPTGRKTEVHSKDMFAFSVRRCSRKCAAFAART